MRGLLLTGSARQADAAELGRVLGEFEDAGGRVALISEHGLPHDSVLPANAQGASQVARLLHDLGRREVGVITGPPT